MRQFWSKAQTPLGNAPSLFKVLAAVARLGYLPLVRPYEHTSLDQSWSFRCRLHYLGVGRGKTRFRRNHQDETGKGPHATMTTTILKDLIGSLCDWHNELEGGPNGPEWEAECRACSTALNALVGIRTQRQPAYAADQALCDKIAEKAETAARWTDEDSKRLEAAFGLS
jgi:hypothetical protein